MYAPLLREESDELLEEALACAEMYRRLNERPYARAVPADVRSATKALLPKPFAMLPPGYRRAMEFKGDMAFADAKYLLQSQVHEARLHPVRNEHVKSHLGKQMLHGLMNCQSIAHVVVPVGRSPIIPWVGEPLALPQVSTPELVKLAERRGWKIVPGGGKGSHVKLPCAGRKTLTIPGNRKTVSPGALRTIAAGLGVSANEIPALL